MNPLFIADLFVLVCEQLETMKEIVRLELLSSHHQKIIRNHGWMKILGVLNDTRMEYIIKNYRFKNLNIYSWVNVNYYATELKNCQILDLSGTNITDESVRELKKC